MGRKKRTLFGMFMLVLTLFQPQEGYAERRNQGDFFLEIPSEADIVDSFDFRATASDAEHLDETWTEWQVRFVDQKTHQTFLLPQRHGTIRDGETLTIHYRNRLVDSQKRVWEAVVKSPQTISVYGPGRQIYAVEYVQTGVVEEETDSFQAEKKLLENWVKTAKFYESELTKEEPERIPDERVFVENQAALKERLLSSAAQIEDMEAHVVYVIGKDMIPSGTILKDIYREEVEYSSLKEAVIRTDQTSYTVVRFSIIRKERKNHGRHLWKSEVLTAESCLRKGRQAYICEICQKKEIGTTAPRGHQDKNGDSICDRCSTRAFEQKMGDEIQAGVAIEGGEKLPMTWVCVDVDYQGGMLYISRETIPVTAFSGYGNLDYPASNPARYFAQGWQNGFSISGDSLMRISAGNGNGYAAILDLEEAKRYQDRMGGDYLTRTMSETGEALIMLREDGTETAVQPDLEEAGIRPAILLSKPDAGTPDRVHWKTGEVQAREIGGKVYLFRCIDQNYGDESGTHRQAALFLCDSVIPANTDSRYSYQKLPDGTYGYVFEPGPIVNFGSSNDYKYSKIRSFLKASEEPGNYMEPIHIGISYAYRGSTGKQKYSQLDASALTAAYIGSQKMTDQIFILSVDEALQYKDWLWRFEGSQHENPESQYGAFSRSYWLRNPMGTEEDADTGYVYVVDLVEGNLHPAAICPKADGQDEEINVTGNIGIRPVFAMPQD